MRLGITLWADRDVAGLARLAACAERTGFDDVWWPDHYMHRDVGATLTACALATDRVRLGTAVTSPLLRHPGALASLFASLAEIAPGRIVAGIGPGGWELPTQLGIHEPRPLTVTRETALLLADLLQGRPATAAASAASSRENLGTIPGNYHPKPTRDFGDPAGAKSRGDSSGWSTHNRPEISGAVPATAPVARSGATPRFPLTGARLDFTPPQPIPLYLAARGPRMMSLAGELADGLITHSLSLPFIEHVVERVELGAQRAAAASANTAATADDTAATAADTAADPAATAATPDDTAAPAGAQRAQAADANTDAGAQRAQAADANTDAGAQRAQAADANTDAGAQRAATDTAATADAEPRADTSADTATPRQPSDCSIAVWLEIFLHDDLAYARDVLRPRCRYMVGGEFDPSMIPLYGLDPDEVMAVRQAVRNTDPKAHELITDDMVDAFSICGSVDRAGDRIDALRSAGVGEVILSFGPGISDDEIASVGEAMLSFLDR